MKGSDKWGQGGGPKIPLAIILVVVLAVSVAGVYLLYLEGSRLTTPGEGAEISSVSTTGVNCNDSSMPAAAQTVEQDPAFSNMTNGLCYNYLGGTQTSMTFAYYNGTVLYPCGDAPVQLPASEIILDLNGSGAISSAQELTPAGVSGQGQSCAASPPVDVVSVEDVESTIPAVPQLNVTLLVGSGSKPVSSLKAELTLNGGTQTFEFGGPTSANPLPPGKAASSTEIIPSGLTFDSGHVYPMTVSGAFSDGQTFTEAVHVQIVGIP